MYCKFTFPLMLFATACSSILSPAQRLQQADTLAMAKHWHKINFAKGGLPLVGWVPELISGNDRLSIYIEGDGFAWVNASRPSSDPTPINPVALQLALAHPKGNVAYLARPCQYTQVMLSACNPHYWQDERFAEQVVAAENQAVEQLKQLFAADKLTLIGYSGGGAVAVLLAARRADVDTLVTVGGNLDHQLWTSQKHLSPLLGSLNPADYVDKLQRVNQWHFTGSEDEIMPTVIARTFAARFPAAKRPQIIEIPGYQHNCCWVENWPELWERIEIK
jgi:predicted esterase